MTAHAGRKIVFVILHAAVLAIHLGLSVLVTGAKTGEDLDVIGVHVAARAGFIVVPFEWEVCAVIEGRG